MHQSLQVLRNCFCGAVALFVIASGAVHRARRRAFQIGVVTAIYFHKPNKRLLTQCIRWLIKHRYVFISADQLLQILYHRKIPPRGAVWLSFDDGCKELVSEVLPVIWQFQTPVTFFIPTGIVGGSGLFPWVRNSNDRQSLTVAELKQIAALREVTIGSHTVSHAIVTTLSDERLRFELGESKRTLECWLGTQIRCFAYPAGRAGCHQELLAETGYSMAANTENAFINKQTDPFMVPRLSIGDNILFPEAICNMVGVWRPVIDRFKGLLRVKSDVSLKSAART
jgi:peptidoglycan/xylan/chitin deacetylase (PgdA/CDA1 family)